MLVILQCDLHQACKWSPSVLACYTCFSKGLVFLRILFRSFKEIYIILHIMAEVSELKVLTCEDILKKVEESSIEPTADPPGKSKKSRKRNRNKSESAEKPTDNVRGLPKSGRFWKTEKKRFRTMVKTPGLATKSLEHKLALRAQLKDTREKSRAIINERKDQKEAKKQRRRDNMKRAEENRKKAEIVQKITNSAKLKRMKKKQLKNIEKRDTTTVT